MLTRQQSQTSDRVAIDGFRIPSLVLMENAGRNCAEKILWHSHQIPRSSQAVVVLCGAGNNGGDGFVIARHLFNQGVKVKVILCCPAEKYSGDALLNLNAISRYRLPIVEFDGSWQREKAISMMTKVKRLPTTWVVDALMGTGAAGEPRGVVKDAIDIANEMSVRRFAVDLPSGLDCDTGVPSKSTFRADITGTMIDAKIGFENPAAVPYLGLVYVVDIGAPKEIVSSVDR